MVWFIVYHRIEAKSPFVFQLKVPNHKQWKTLIWLPPVVTVVINSDIVCNFTAQASPCALQLSKDVVSLFYPSYTFLQISITVTTLGQNTCTFFWTIRTSAYHIRMEARVKRNHTADNTCSWCSNDSHKPNNEGSLKMCTRQVQGPVSRKLP